MCVTLVPTTAAQPGAGRDAHSPSAQPCVSPSGLSPLPPSVQWLLWLVLELQAGASARGASAPKAASTDISPGSRGRASASMPDVWELPWLSADRTDRRWGRCWLLPPLSLLPPL